MHSPPTPAIEATGLRVVRGGNEVLHGISFSVPSGTITGLLGPSGCGKTTLMRAIVGVQIVEAGEVTVFGLPAGSPDVRPRVGVSARGLPAGSPELRSRVGYVTQAPSVYGDLTVRENLEYFAQVLDAGPEAGERIIDAVRLTDHSDQIVRSLSGGERSRVSLATALLNDPELLILDEPTVGLDPVLREELWDEFHRLAERGTTLLVSSHVMDEAANCDRLLLMRDGRILAQESPQHLRRRTGTDDLGQAFLRIIEHEEHEGAPR
jgi:ABC-2 type transport system ATP-binding protein